MLPPRLGSPRSGPSKPELRSPRRPNPRLRNNADPSPPDLSVEQRVWRNSKPSIVWILPNGIVADARKEIEYRAGRCSFCSAGSWKPRAMLCASAIGNGRRIWRKAEVLSHELVAKFSAIGGSHAVRRIVDFMKHYDAVVAGGGLIGASIAFELASAGLSVAVFDAQNPGREASWASAGMISPAPESPGTIPFVPISLASVALYPQFIEKVEALSGMDAGRKDGAVDVLPTATLRRTQHDYRAAAWRRSAPKPESGRMGTVIDGRCSGCRLSSGRSLWITARSPCRAERGGKEKAANFGGKWREVNMEGTRT